MSQRLFKQKRSKEGRTIVSDTWSGRYRLSWMIVEKSVSLKTRDKQVAAKRLDEFVRRLELQHEGLPVPGSLWGGEMEELDGKVLRYLHSLEAKQIGSKHVVDTGKRIRRVASDMGWATVQSISPSSFEKWRSEKAISLHTKKPLSAKSKNEYLVSLNAFLNWLRKTGEIEKNPLETMDKVETRGRQKKVRRSWTDGELRTMLNAEVYYGFALWIAARTGLRRGEIQSLVWGDVLLDTENPMIQLRSSTTKNGKADPIPLVPELAEDLVAYRPADWKPTDKVLRFRIPKVDRIKKDMEALGIVYKDSLGRDLDFHALRYTYITFLAKNGASHRNLQALSRHSDPKLSANVYTDASQLDTFHVVKNLPRLLSDEKGTRIRTHFADFSSHLVSEAGRRRKIPVIKVQGAPVLQDPDSDSLSHELAGNGTKGKVPEVLDSEDLMGAGVGFEPTTFRL